MLVPLAVRQTVTVNVGNKIDHSWFCDTRACQLFPRDEFECIKKRKRN